MFTCYLHITYFCCVCLNLNGFQLLITPQNVFKTLTNYILFFIPAKVIYLATIILEKKMGKPITWQPPHRYWDIMIFYLDMRFMPHYSARYKDHLGGYCCYLLSQVTHSADCGWVGCHYYYRASVISVICIMNQIGTIYQIFVSKLQNPSSYYLGQVIICTPKLNFVLYNNSSFFIC